MLCAVLRVIRVVVGRSPVWSGEGKASHDGGFSTRV